MPYLVKNTSSEIKDVDLEARRVAGHFSVFDVIDSDMDIIERGAFAKTVAQRGPGGSDRIMHLLQHNPMQPLGKPRELKEDDKGLFFSTVLSDTTWGRDTIKLYADGVLTEHSIGFEIINSHSETRDEADVQVITEIKLWEGSTVTWGANEFATVTAAKSRDEISRLLERYNTLQKAYYDGDYTDDTFKLIEVQKAHIESLITKSLSEKPDIIYQERVEEEPVATTPKLDRARVIDSQFKTFAMAGEIRKRLEEFSL